MVRFIDKIFAPIFVILSFCVHNNGVSQQIDANEVLNKLERLEKNVSDLQKGKFDSLDSSLSSGYISRNETRIDQVETDLRQNFGTLEEIQNQINLISEKLDLIDKDFQSRISQIEKKIDLLEKKDKGKKNDEVSIKKTNVPSETKITNDKKIVLSPQKKLSEEEIKKKYENAIKLLWASKFEDAEIELVDLKRYNPDDLMPNIQYWLGEVHYAQKSLRRLYLNLARA